MSDKPDDIINASVSDVLELQNGLQKFEDELAASDERFRAFLEMQRNTKKQIEDTFKVIMDQMVKYGVKSIKNDWGSITLATRQTVKADVSKLPPELTKVVPDDKKIRANYDLTGELPDGAEIVTSAPYLVKKFKQPAGNTIVRE